jgi:excisionase family DNA binding protein
MPGSAAHKFPEFLTVAESSERMKLSTKTIRRMIADKRLKAAMVGRQWRIDERDVLRLLMGLGEGQ